ncbi:hypothetical protein BAUCODRAFT_57336, partial [Baudoinia panamericana UAMH 10762]
MAIHNPEAHNNAFVRVMRKAYHPIGFKKGYNAVLWFIFAGALLGFSLSKLPIMNVNGVFSKQAAPGEWFWYSKKFYNIFIHIHLICIIPGSIFAVVQFIPIIRYKLLLLHRMNGYLVSLLLVAANIGALGIARHAFGGSISTQTAVGVLAIGTTTSLFLAIYNIKRLQIDQHRAWMLRTWFWAGSIITVRMIMIIIATVISQTSNYFTYYTVMRCEQISFTAGEHIASTYQSCKANPTGLAIVRANLSDPANALEAAAALQLGFDTAMWLAIVLHVVGIELYLRLTPAETERLRKVSYERQLERGMRQSGSAGLVAERLGDAEEYKP